MMTRVLHRYLIASLLLTGVCATAVAAEPQSGASVYLLGMRSGFDHFLANQLTEYGLLAVTTDADQAEYILTDSVGPGFEQSMETLYPKPKPAEPNEEPEAKDDKKGATSGSLVQAYSNVASRVTSFSRADGTYFLVNRHSRTVVWSTFLNHRDTRNESLHKDAGQVVKRLKKFMKEAASLTTVPAVVAAPAEP